MTNVLIALGGLLLVAIICVVRRSRRPPQRGTPYHDRLVVRGAAAITEMCGPPDEPSPTATK